MKCCYFGSKHISAPKLFLIFQHYNIIMYLNRETLKCSSILTVNISRMQVPQDFSSGILACHYRCLSVDSLAGTGSRNLIPNIFFDLKFSTVFACILVIINSSPPGLALSHVIYTCVKSAFLMQKLSNLIPNIIQYLRVQV